MGYLLYRWLWIIIHTINEKICDEQLSIDRGFSHLPSDYIFYKYKNGTLSSKPTYRFAVGGWGAGTWIVNGKNVSRKECMKQLNKISGKREGYPMHKYSASTYKKYI